MIHKIYFSVVHDSLSMMGKGNTPPPLQVTLCPLASILSGTTIGHQYLFFVIWLAPRAGKVKRILCSVPEWARWAYLARFVPTKAKVFGAIFWPYNKSFIDQVYSVKMAGYWPRSFLRIYELQLQLRLGP